MSPSRHIAQRIAIITNSYWQTVPNMHFDIFPETVTTRIMKMLIALLIGTIAGIVDVLPMIILKINRTSCLSAFFQWLALGLVIPFVHWNINPCLKGIFIAELFAVPIMILTCIKNRRDLIPIILFSAILGAAVGFAGSQLIETTI